MSFLKTKLLRAVPALALCAVIGMSPATAANTKLLKSQPAADTTTATIGKITTVKQSPIGSIGSTEAMTKVKEDLAAKEAARKAAEEAARKAAEEAARKAAEEAEAARRAALQYSPTYRRTVSRSSAYSVTENITVNGKALGNFKLTFYCSCASCSGGWGSSTATGSSCVEGRTIAVDPRVIPLGSKVYIEGFGDFIAEDTGGAIKGNRIDVYISDHSRCNALGVAHANVYVMS